MHHRSTEASRPLRDEAHNVHDEENVPPVQYVIPGSDTAAGPSSSRRIHAAAHQDHHSEESSSESYDNAPLILGSPMGSFFLIVVRFERILLI